VVTSKTEARPAKTDLLSAALERNIELSAVFPIENGKSEKRSFRPLHRVYIQMGGSEPIQQYILGSLPGDPALPYALVHEAAFQNSALTHTSFDPVKSIQIEFDSEGTLTFILSFGAFDTILLFTCKEPAQSKKRKNQPPVYSILTRMDIFRRNIKKAPKGL
jgi:hypothetical protein